MISMNRQNRAWRLTAGCLLTFFLMTICPGPGWVPAALATARQDLDRAQDLYDFAEFQQALELVTGLIDGGRLSGTEARDAYILRARCAVGLGLDKMAEEDFCAVHKLDSNWAPDPVVYPKDEVDVFTASMGQCDVVVAEPKPEVKRGGKAWYKKPVTWAVGAGVILVAVVVAVAGGGGDDPEPDPDLPGFPSLPD